MKNSTGIRFRRFVKNFLRDWQLYLIILIPAAYIVLFCYGPMYGLQIAFRDYRVADGIVGSKWVGFKWFAKFLGDYNFRDIFMNTLILSLYSIVVGFPLPVIFALLLNSLRSEKFKGFVQTVSYLPHFISITVLVSILNLVFSPVVGVYGYLYRFFTGSSGFPYNFIGRANAFRHVYVWSGIWQELGWSSIIYVAALSGVSAELHEAARIDGATRFQRILHVDFPSILPTVCIMLILRCGSLISVGFEKTFLMQTSLNLSVSEVISTYVYKKGMASARDFSFGAAVGLFNTAINLVLLLTVNRLSRKLTEDEVSLF